MKALACLVPLVLLGADALPLPEPNSDVPPVRFRGEAASVVIFANDVTQFCNTPPRPGYVLLGCQFERNGVPIIVVPNPCVLADRELYARIACHEKAHSIGWSGEHEA